MKLLVIIGLMLSSPAMADEYAQCSDYKVRKELRQHDKEIKEQLDGIEVEIDRMFTMIGLIVPTNVSTSPTTK